MKFVKNIFRWRTIKYGLFLFVFTILACELILRIYNPFPFRLKGSDVLLVRNQRYIINNAYLPGLDSMVVLTKNNLGFRGPEMPNNFNDCFSVITVGGSTTECWCLAEKDSWPFLLGNELEHDFNPVWLNNAGVNGHSSWAHHLLIGKYIKQLHPKVLFMLVGWNDVGRKDLAWADGVEREHNTGVKKFLDKTSALYDLAVNIKRHYRYSEYSETKNYPYLIKHGHALLITSRQYNDSVARAELPLLAAYEKRLDAIIDTCKENGIVPVLITQPGMLGNGIEPETGCNLDDYKLFDTISGKLFSDLLKMYNKTTMEAAKEKGVFCVDLANLLPPSIVNYYDICHYSKAGCKTVAQIIYRQSVDYLKQHFPTYLKQ